MATDFLHGYAGLHGTAFTRPGLLSREDEQAIVASAGAPRSHKAGFDLVSEGVPASDVFLLVRGWACRYKLTRDGARQITGIVMPGELCNIDSFMLEQVDFGLRTLSAVTLVGWPRERLQKLADERPGVARIFTWLAIVENAALGQWALSLGRLSARERLAHFLCEMSLRLRGDRSDATSFELPITQEQVADTLGLTAVHVNRTLRELKEQGLIDVAGRRIDVPDMAALRRVGGFDAAYLHAAPASRVR